MGSLWLPSPSRKTSANTPTLRFFQKGEKTDCFVRISTVAGERGAADTERDIRGCAIKLYTKEGNWDIVGNNTPVFFLRDVHNFVGLNRAVKRDPATGLHDANNTWDFWTMLPEAFHQITITMSDRGIPATLRNMDMFGEHTFSLINKEGKTSVGQIPLQDRARH
jgi:catalase